MMKTLMTAATALTIFAGVATSAQAGVKIHIGYGGGYGFNYGYVPHCTIEYKNVKVKHWGAYGVYWTWELRPVKVCY